MGHVTWKSREFVPPDIGKLLILVLHQQSMWSVVVSQNSKFYLDKEFKVYSGQGIQSDQLKI